MNNQNGCKADTCSMMSMVSSFCMECELIKQDEIKETNKLRQLLLDQQKIKDKAFRKLVGGTC